MTDQAEAQRLIESVFGDATVSAEDMPRAHEAVSTFSVVADAFEQGRMFDAAMMLSWRIQYAAEPGQFAHDVCAAGAIAVANQLEGLRECDCGSPRCTGLDIELGTENKDPICRRAETLVNVASAGMLELLTRLLARTLREFAVEDLQALAMVLVSLRGDAARMAARYEP